MGLIYIIKNSCNDKVYIGQTTTTMENRFKRHINSAKNNFEPSMILYNAMRKYGFDNFYIDLLEDNIDDAYLNDRERYWIHEYNSIRPNGYNIRDGGEDCGRRYVYKINSTTNKIIKRYDSLAQAAEENNIDTSNLSKVCRGNEVTCKGYKWSYVDEYDEDRISSTIPKASSREIYQIDNATGNVLNKFENIAEAVKLTKVCQSSLSMCLSGKYKTANGYNWCYVDEYDEDTFVTKSRYKKVLQIDKATGKSIKEWNSAKDAAEYIGGNGCTIRSACRGKVKTAYGYEWKYI